MTTILKGIQKGRGASLRQSGADVVYTERHRYVVLSDDKNESPLAVLSTAGLPRVMISTIEGTSGQCTCTGLDPKQDDGSPYVWFVDADFSTKAEKQTTDDNPDPTTWVPIYTGKIESYPEVMYRDNSPGRKPYLNTAFDKFPEPLIYKRPVIVYDFFQYEPNTVTDIQIGDRNDTINSVAFKDFPEQTLKMSVSSFERGFYFGVYCVRINYSIAYKKNKWLNQPLNVGYAYLDSSGVRHPSEKLVALNPDGTKKADNVDPDVLTFYEFREIPFTFLR